MSNDSTPVFVAAAVSGLLCLVIGGAAAYFVLLPAPSPPPPTAAAPQPVVPTEQPEPGKAADKPPDKPAAPSPEVEKLRKGNRQLAAERDALRTENHGLKEKLAQAENELKAFRALQASRRGKLIINFAEYADLKELQDADWKELGAALQSMSPALVQLGQAMREGKPPDREALDKIGKDNMRLIKFAVTMDGKLPSNAGNVNGEYTHPVSMVNLLAAQLEAMGDPLSEDQKLKLAEYGEEYERRWKALQQGYTAETLALQKVLDEADLKIWFTERMFSVTTQQQKAKVVDPSIEGVMGLDLYSPGLLLAPIMETVRVTEKDALKAKFKDWLAGAMHTPRELMDGSEFAFDEWQSKLSLEPLPASQTRLTTITQVMAAGRAQLALMQILAATALSSAENVKKVRESKAIGVPQLIRQD